MRKNVFYQNSYGLSWYRTFLILMHNHEYHAHCPENPKLKVILYTCCRLVSTLTIKTAAPQARALGRTGAAFQDASIETYISFTIFRFLNQFNQYNQCNQWLYIASAAGALGRAGATYQDATMALLLLVATVALLASCQGGVKNFTLLLVAGKH